MKNAWRHRLMLSFASFLAPRDQRAEWLEWWRSELWYVSRREATPFCLGAFRDALLIRQNSVILVRQTPQLLQLPQACLAFLGTLSGLSILIENRLENMLTFPAVHGTAAFAGFAELMFFYLVLAATALLVKDSPGSEGPIPRPNTVRSWIFLILKIGLVLPLLNCMLVAVVVIHLPFFPLSFFAGCVLLFRWIFADQRHRCPVCLQLLGEPTRIGTSSRTFLQWYGFESMCARGHGLLHAPDMSSSYSQGSKWLDLDDSLRTLGSGDTGHE